MSDHDDTTRPEPKPTSPSGAPEMAEDERAPSERIESDAGLSPGALQNGAAAGAAIGGRRGSNPVGED